MADVKNEVVNETETETSTRGASPQKVWCIARNVLMGLAVAICAIMLIVTVWLCIDKFILKSKVPSFCGYSVLIVATGSMESTIYDGDLILIKKTEDYKIGDIITFAHPDETIPTTHRIWKYNEQTGEYSTRGDANNTFDTLPVTEEEIYGEVVCIMHGLGLFVGWLSEGGGLIYLIAVVMILVVGIYLILDEKKRHLYLGEGENTEGNVNGEAIDNSGKTDGEGSEQNTDEKK